MSWERAKEAQDQVWRFYADNLVWEARQRSLSTEVGELQVTPVNREVMLQLAAELYRRLHVKHCQLCACTEPLACDGGCSWAELADTPSDLRGAPLCTSCARDLIRRDVELVAKLADIKGAKP